MRAPHTVLLDAWAAAIKRAGRMAALIGRTT